MKYKIIRLDGGNNEITNQSFQGYDDAYDLLANIYEDVCCSDSDYGNRPFYEILEIKNLPNKSI